MGEGMSEHNYRILPGFDPFKPVMLIDLKTNERTPLEKPLRYWGQIGGRGVWCTAKRLDGPFFYGDGKGYTRQSLIAVNIEGRGPTTNKRIKK